MITKESIRDILDRKYDEYNRLQFIDNDPISIPKTFTKKADIEIAAFLTATIAWGNRKSILKSARKIMDLMDNSPFDYIVNYRDHKMKLTSQSVHRTFNFLDLNFFFHSLHTLYCDSGGLEEAFSGGPLERRIREFPATFFRDDVLKRSRKHVARVDKGSTAKRINMFLRWMVRFDPSGVDFGLWKSIRPAELFIPLDVHSGRVARKLGLLQRKQNDWLAVTELTSALREFDPIDPIKYDFALFGIGVNG